MESNTRNQRRSAKELLSCQIGSGRVFDRYRKEWKEDNAINHTQTWFVDR